MGETIEARARWTQSQEADLSVLHSVVLLAPSGYACLLSREGPDVMAQIGIVRDRISVQRLLVQLCVTLRDTRQAGTESMARTDGGQDSIMALEG